MLLISFSRGSGPPLILHIFDEHQGLGSMEDDTLNARRNPSRNPECWGDFSQLVEIEKLKFLCISQYKSKLRF